MAASLLKSPGLFPLFWLILMLYFGCFSLVLLFTSLADTLPIFSNPSAWIGYDTKSIFKRSLTGLNSELSFP